MTRPLGLGDVRSPRSTRPGWSRSNDALPGGLDRAGAFLRREGLYSSHISEWRRARDAGARDGLAAEPKPRRSAEQVELENCGANATFPSNETRSATLLTSASESEKASFCAPPA